MRSAESSIHWVNVCSSSTRTATAGTRTQSDRIVSFCWRRYFHRCCHPDLSLSYHKWSLLQSEHEQRLHAQMYDGIEPTRISALFTSFSRMSPSN